MRANVTSQRTLLPIKDRFSRPQARTKRSDPSISSPTTTPATNADMTPYQRITACHGLQAGKPVKDTNPIVKDVTPTSTACYLECCSLTTQCRTSKKDTNISLELNLLSGSSASSGVGRSIAKGIPAEPDKPRRQEECVVS